MGGGGVVFSCTPAMAARALRRLTTLAPAATSSSPSPALLLDHNSTSPDPTSKWVILPAVPRLHGLARFMDLKELTAIKWVARCCPEISHSAIEKLFRMRKVRMCLQDSQHEESEQLRLKRISRKDPVVEGSVLYLPKRFMECKDDTSEMEGSSKVTEGILEAAKLTVSREKEYKPTHHDIEWAKELVLHVDAHIVAINKPPGLAVQGGVGVGRNLDVLLGPALSFDYSEVPKLVHRLDKETSGIMVIGRTQESTAVLHNLFRAKTENAISGCKDTMFHDRVIKRKYWALVIGRPTARKGCINAPLKKVVLDGGKSETIVVADDSNSETLQEAITEYRVLGPSIHGCTWLELHPLTGRKHQLRVHCSQALGMPILGDYKYGRQVHESWCCRDGTSNTRLENFNVHRNDDMAYSKNSRSASHVDVKGSVTSKKPFLHLHSRLLAIPKIRELKKKKPPGYDHGQKQKVAFVDSLRLLAPLPPHMKASWSLLPPTLKDISHRQVERQKQ